MSWTEKFLHLGPAQQDDHTVLLGQNLGFAWSCKAQAMLAAKMENQNKMPDRKSVV